MPSTGPGSEQRGQMESGGPTAAAWGRTRDRTPEDQCCGLSVETIGRQSQGWELLLDAEASASTWTEFWTSQGANAHCMQDASPALWRPLEEHWNSLASRLPPRTRVLDLGCGAGVVGRMLLAARPELQVVGIDLATIPHVERGMTILSGIAMEELPFAAASFGAAVSQFGYEYGDPEGAAPELARVLSRGAPLSLVAHHSDSSILAKSRSRMQAQALLLGEAMRAAVLAGDVAGFGTQASNLQAAHGADPLISECLRLLRPHLYRGEMQRLQAWNALGNALSLGIEINRQLERSSLTPQRLERHLSILSGYFSLAQPAVITRNDTGEPVAYRIEGVRKIC